MSLSHPIVFAIATAMAILIALTRRRRVLQKLAAVCFAIAGRPGPLLSTRPSGTVDVMVDLSPSTRGASFRSRSVLQHRVKELVGTSRVRWLEFADESKPLSIASSADSLAEITSDQTRLTCRGINPVLLFSDGNFAQVDASPPTFPVLDPNLENPQDSSVQSIQTSGDHWVATVENGQSGNVLRWNSGQTSEPPLGRSIVTATTKPDPITARIDGHDRWPENDSLTVFPPSSKRLQRWWIGDTPPPGFVRIEPSAFPVEGRALLGVSLIVTDDLSASALDQNQQAALIQFVHDFGGNLLNIIGSGSFALHRNAQWLTSLSPLSLDPPTPQRRWIALLDRSGSMAAETNGSTRFQQAVETAKRLVRYFPPADSVSVGDFATSLSWVVRDANPKDAANALGLPSNRTAGGPTNLDAALRAILSQTSGALPTEVLLLSDGQAEIDDPTGLVSRLAASHVRVTLLDRESDLPSPAVKVVVAKTGGQVVSDDQAASWADHIIEQSNTAPRHDDMAAVVRFDPSLGLPTRSVVQWTATWLKHDAIALTENMGPRAARWPVGLGSVASLSFQPDQDELAAIQRLMIARPSDSTEHVEWTDANPLSVDVTAQGTPALSLRLGNDSPLLIPQIGPNEFRISTSAPASPVRGGCA